MKLIDLHVHSNASDGSLSPSEVVNIAISKALGAIALTDHDTVSGIDEALTAAATSDLEVIPGIELSCYYIDREIHILGLFIDYKNKYFNEQLELIRQERINRNLKMIKLFNNDGYNITLEKLCAGNPDSVITRAHFARVLISEGICKNKDEAFRKYLGIKCPYYLPKPAITPELALSLIRDAGGIPILAHPLLYKLGYSQVEKMLEALIPLGLKGIEVYHSSNNIYESDRLRSMALKYNLVISGGSDFHGAVKPDISIGSGRGGMRITYHILDNIKSSIKDI